MTVITVTLHPALDKVLRVPKLRPNEIARATIEMVYGGGKGNNAARALMRTNARVIASGFQGGHVGAFLNEELQREGIATRFVTCRQPTRTSVLVHEDDTGNTYAIYEPGQSVEPEEVEALLACFDTLLQEASLVLLCGSGQGAVLAPVFARMIERARSAGVHCILDSSGEALTQAIPARPYMVKVNTHELSSYFDRPLDSRQAQIEALRDLHSKGVRIAALSRGEEGMLATDGVKTWEGWLKMERIVNVVGCGDSLLAGVAKAVLTGADLKEVVRFGVALGTANTQVRGAGFIDSSTVEALLPRVELHLVR